MVISERRELVRVARGHMLPSLFHARARKVHYPHAHMRKCTRINHGNAFSAVAAHTALRRPREGRRTAFTTTDITYILVDSGCEPVTLSARSSRCLVCGCPFQQVPVADS